MDFSSRYNNLIQATSDISNMSNHDLLMLLEEAKLAMAEYDELQLTVKLDGNSLYGVSASIFYSLVDFDVAEDITCSARHFAIIVDIALNKFFSKWATPENLKIIQKFYPQVTRIENFNNYKRDSVNDLCVYGDTDSRYLDIYAIYQLMFVGDENNLFPDLSEDGNVELAKFSVFLMENFVNDVIAKTLNEDIDARGGTKGYLRMAHETTTRRTIFQAKKKYIMPIIYKDGKIFSKPKFTAKGVELKRGEMNKRIKKIIETLVKKFVLEGYTEKMMREEILKLYKYIKIRKDKDFIYRITSVNNMKDVVQQPSGIYTCDKTHIQAKIALSWCNFLRDNNLEGRFKKPFNGQKMNYYYDRDGKVIGVPDDVNINDVEGLPEPNWNLMIEQTLVKSVMKYIYDENKFDDKDINNFLLGVKRLDPTKFGID